MISKELLSEVLDLYITDITYPVMESQTSLFSDKPEIIPNYSIMEYTGSNGFMGATLTINIHELAFKCKEWALKQGNLTILSGTYLNTVKGLFQNKQYIGYAVIQQFLIDEYKTGQYYLKTKHKVKSISEQQAVFDACQRILDNRNNK